MAELRDLMESLMDRAEREAAPSLEVALMEVSEAFPHETEKLLKSLQDGGEDRTRVQAGQVFLI